MIPNHMARNLVSGALCLTLTACVSWTGGSIPLPAGRRLRVVVLPVECTVPIRKLSDIQTVPKGRAPAPDEPERVAALVAQAAEAITLSLGAGLEGSGRVEVVPPDALFDPASVRLEAIAAMGERLGADAVLQVQLSGYGKIKKKWQVLLVASGMVEALAQGIAAYKVSDNRWVGIGWAAEETVQELLTWVGGVALFNRLFTPVILEARLYGPAGGKPLWRKTIISTGRKKDFKALPKDERKRKEVRLSVVREKAAQALAAALVKKLRPARTP